MYQSKLNIEFDKADLFLYEEVTKMAPFKRRTLAIVGPPAVGRRTLKGRLINSNPEKFAGVIPGKDLRVELFLLCIPSVCIIYAFIFQSLHVLKENTKKMEKITGSSNEKKWRNRLNSINF